MIIFDQLRIADNGQALYLNAHVNSAEYFDNMYIKKVTICIEDQVNETAPTVYTDKYIFQQDLEPKQQLVEIYDKTQLLFEQNLLDTTNGKGGWKIEYHLKEGTTTNYLSVAFSGKYSQFDTGFQPRLFVTTNAFDPTNGIINYNEVLFIVDGVMSNEKGHKTWLFKGKGEIKKTQALNFYLYTQTEDSHYEFVRLEDTDDRNFLHFLWQIYGEYEEITAREIHLVLGKNDFNGKFKASDLSHNMFFVYIECGGVPAPNTPCRLDEMTTLGVTFDYGLIYYSALGYTQELANSCEIPKNFIDFILHTDALKLAIETEHYVPAIEHWKWLMGVKDRVFGYSTIKPCGCHG